MTYSVDSTYIYATGVETTTQLRCSESVFSDDIEVINTSESGDSLVPSWSATVGRSGNCVKNYTPHGHMYVVESSTPINYIIDCMKG